MNKHVLAAVVIAVGLPFASQAAVSVSIDIAPPPLPVYAQPVIPSPGYIWTPGYWRWNAADGDYYWVPGTWIAPPYVGALWTPGYWGWGNGSYAWHGGYWGTHIGFYGGVNYGFGYVGHGYEGGYWNVGVFNYNRRVNNVNTTIVHNVYDKTVVENNTHVSFNGGQGGIAAQPNNEERLARAEPHTPPTGVQHQHEQQALRTPEQRASFNHGAPVNLAMAHPAPLAHAGGQPGGHPMHAEAGGGRPMHEGGREMQGQHAPQAHGGGPHGGERREGNQAH